MESKQLEELTKQSIIDQIENWHCKKGIQKVNSIRFDMEYNLDLLQYKVVRALERVMKSSLCNDLNLSDEFLEKVKIYVNGLR